MLVAIAALAVVLGGILKGAIGAGVPLIAAPAITLLYDVQTAVAVLVVPNLLSNVWQAWSFRRQALPLRFQLWFAGGGMAGVVVGTYLLVALPQEVLAAMVALSIFGYIALRLTRPGWVLSRALGDRLAGAAGALGGILQGATAISAPVSMTFLNAMRLPREAFIGTISMFFITMTAAQIPVLIGVGILTMERILTGFAILGLVFLSMPLGSWLGRRFSARVFDRVMLAVLALIALRIGYGAIF